MIEMHEPSVTSFCMSEDGGREWWYDIESKNKLLAGQPLHVKRRRLLSRLLLESKFRFSADGNHVSLAPVQGMSVRCHHSLEIERE